MMSTKGENSISNFVVMVNVYILLSVFFARACLCSALPGEDKKVCSVQVTVKRWRVVSESSTESTHTCDDSDEGQYACDQPKINIPHTSRQPYTALETRYFCCPGYLEDQYGNCKGCPPGRYGRGCIEQCTCPDTAYELCNHVDGSCTCTAGWTGNECQSSCQAGRFGFDCSQTCSCTDNAHTACHHVTGECICKPGWIGGNCEQECESGFYGRDCLSVCSCPANTLPGCNHVTGRCRCSDGWTGEQCDQRCQAGRFGFDCSQTCSCTDNAHTACHHVTGECICKAGWIGGNCEQECESGFYGRDCLSVCSCPANALPGCNHVTGRCRCSDGWTGEQCDQRCIEGFFGPNCQNMCTCQNGGLCDHVTGVCQCPAGWNGPQCQSRCSKGKHGPNCDQKCDCLDAISCDPVDGTCHCLPGIKGEKCDQGCSPWTYGSTCSSSCICERNTTVVCSPLNGTCLCLFGWTGERCNIPERRLTQETMETEQYNLPLIVGITAAAVLLIAGTVVILLINRRRSSYSSSLRSLKSVFSRSMLTKTVILEPERRVSMNQDDTGLCAAEAQLPISHIDDVGVENGIFRHDVEHADRTGISACDGSTECYDRLSHNVNVKVTDTGSHNSYDHVHTQIHSAGALDDNIYDVTNTDEETRQKRPSSPYYQSFAV